MCGIACYEYKLYYRNIVIKCMVLDKDWISIEKNWEPRGKPQIGRVYDKEFEFMEWHKESSTKGIKKTWLLHIRKKKEKIELELNFNFISDHYKNCSKMD